MNPIDSEIFWLGIFFHASRGKGDAVSLSSPNYHLINQDNTQYGILVANAWISYTTFPYYSSGFYGDNDHSSTAHSFNAGSRIKRLSYKGLFDSQYLCLRRILE